MDKYELQEYFEKLCDVYYSAQNNAMRTREKMKQEGNTEESVNAEQYWSSSAWNQFLEITSHMARVRQEKYQVIITTKQEVFAFIHYCQKQYPEAYSLINMEYVHLIDFPKDEMSTAFLEAYTKQNREKIIELYYKYF